MGVSFSEDRITFRGDLTTDEIKQIVRNGGVDTLQTDTLPLDVSTLKRLNEEYFAKFPDTELRIYTYEICDLSPLKVMDKVRKLSVETSSGISNIEAVYSLPALSSLCIEVPKIEDKDFFAKIPVSLETLDLDIAAKSFDLKNLTRFTELKILGLHKCKKNIEAISELKQLQSLKLQGITPDSYSFVNDLPKLQNLAISGGNTEDLSELYGNQTITGLYLFHLPKINNLDILANLPNLRTVEVGQLANVSKLPDFSKSKLQHLCFENMKNLLDFKPLQFAPQLKSVAETVCPAALMADSVLPVMLNSEIEQCAFFTSSSKKNKEIEEMANKYNKKCETNAHIVRSIIFPDGRM